MNILIGDELKMTLPKTRGSSRYLFTCLINYLRHLMQTYTEVWQTCSEGCQSQEVQSQWQVPNTSTPRTDGFNLAVAELIHRLDELGRLFDHQEHQFINGSVATLRP